MVPLSFLSLNKIDQFVFWKEKISNKMKYRFIIEIVKSVRGTEENNKSV